MSSFHLNKLRVEGVLKVCLCLTSGLFESVPSLSVKAQTQE